MKRTLHYALMAMALMTAGGLQANPGYYYPQQRAMPAPQVDPAMVLQRGVDRLLDFLRQPEKLQGPQLAAFLEAEVAPFFDFDYMAQWVGGRYYGNMSPKQRAHLANRLEEKLLKAISERLAGYDDQNVRVLKPRRVSANEVKVRVMILNPGGYPAQIDFRLYRSEQGWRVFDIAANGSSVLAHYRQEFARTLSQGPNGPRWR